MKVTQSIKDVISLVVVARHDLNMVQNEVGDDI